MSSELMLIDGHSILNRAFYAIPPLTAPDGTPTGAIYGFLNILFKFIDEEKPNKLIVAFDRSEPTFRHEKYKEYKGTRKSMDHDLRVQVPLVKDVLKSMNITIAEKPGYEADDIIGTLSKRMSANGEKVVIVSGDKDLLQLLDDNITMKNPKTRAGKTTVDTYTPAELYEEYGVTPEEFVDLKALMGDTSDNIPGAKGIGPKTAMPLIAEYHTVENLLDHIDDIKSKSTAKKLTESKDNIILSKFLAKIDVDAPIETDIDGAKLENLCNDNSMDFLIKLNLKTFVERLKKKGYGSDGGSDSNGTAASDKDVNQPDENAMQPASNDDIEELFGELMAESAAANGTAGSDRAATVTPEKEVHIDDNIFNPVWPMTELKTVEIQDFDEYTKLSDDIFKNVSNARNASISLMNDGDNVFVSVASGDSIYTVQEPYLSKEQILSGVRELFDRISRADNRETFAKIYVNNINFFIKNLELETSYGFPVDNIFDLGLAAYIVDPNVGNYSYDVLAFTYLKEVLETPKDLKKDVQKQTVLEANVLFHSGREVYSKLVSVDGESLYKDVELPTSLVLADMSMQGIRVQKDELNNYTQKLSERIEIIREQIIEEAGVDFNISSPKQLGEVLFDRLHLPHGKKTKTGYSTAADVLESLAPEYTIVANVLEYRTLTKLKSTYGEGLVAFIKPDGRIHGEFNQTVTATGRISSSQPNLQNIPIRMEIGRQIRKVFVPKDGCVFLDADYSQIELRVLAHMSGDEKLIDAYRSAEDIHTMTASQVFHVPVDMVTPEMRRNAKAVNFGIIYGISSFGLSNDLSISVSEAKQYIDSYFHTYPKIKTFLDNLVQSAKDKGYSETILGRKRPIPDLSSKNFRLRSFGERVAMNAPIQGTAADIMKIAMIRVFNELYSRNLKSRLILQVHDELLIETYKDEVDEVKSILEEAMTKAVKLKVPLMIETGEGDNWLNAH
ncbi:MAG: DNA polymerase I [Lachnospiraceae bacterium]|nr:DNA polymerase I [Lachnospiraceae bacterium]